MNCRVQSTPNNRPLLNLHAETILGRIDFKENIYFRKETIEDNLSSGIIDLRKYQDAHISNKNWVKNWVKLGLVE